VCKKEKGREKLHHTGIIFKEGLCGVGGVGWGGGGGVGGVGSKKQPNFRTKGGEQVQRNT